MNKLVGMWICGVMVAACATVDAPDGDVETSTATSASQSYSPMGFARFSSAGTASAGSFNSSGAGISSVHLGAGSYQVTFNGLGVSSSVDGEGGNVQLVAETVTNHKCRVGGWSGAPNVVINVQCTDVAGTPSDTGFAVQFYRYSQPAAPNTSSTSIAYSWVTGSGSGLQPAYWDYNSSGVHNSVSHPSTGSYTVTIPGATVVNASIMVSAYGSSGGTVCSVSYWFSGVVAVQCRDASGALVDNAFSFSYAWTGPTLYTQGGHAWFDGSSANASYSAGQGKIIGCGVPTVTGSVASALVTLKVSGNLGSWSATPFERASFATFYGGDGGYCNIQSELATGVAPSSVGTTILQCYTPTGVVVATPTLTFTHVTNDVGGPC